MILFGYYDYDYYYYYLSLIIDHIDIEIIYTILQYYTTISTITNTITM